jgi:hypothetical protein
MVGTKVHYFVGKDVIHSTITEDEGNLFRLANGHHFRKDTLEHWDYDTQLTQWDGTPVKLFFGEYKAQ